jgi:hypothetical protein
MKGQKSIEYGGWNASIDFFLYSRSILHTVIALAVAQTQINCSYAVPSAVAPATPSDFYLVRPLAGASGVPLGSTHQT